MLRRADYHHRHYTSDTEHHMADVNLRQNQDFGGKITILDTMFAKMMKFDVILKVLSTFFNFFFNDVDVEKRRPRFRSTRLKPKTKFLKKKTISSEEKLKI